MTDKKDNLVNGIPDNGNIDDNLKAWHSPRIIILDSVNKITKGGNTAFNPKEAPPQYKIS